MVWIATAVIGSAVIGGISSYNASKQAGKSADKIAATGDAANQLGRDQFDWFKGEYARTAPARDKQEATANRTAESQIAGMDFATSEAKALSDRNKTVFQPLEDKIVSGAQTYDTPERRAQAASEASADVTASFDRAQQGATRALMRTGASPTGAVNAALVQDAALAKAKATAGATTMATRNVEQQGYARMQDAAAIGKGIIGNQGTQQQIATNTGTAAVSAGAAGLAASTSGAGLMQTGFAGAANGLTSAGNLYGQAQKVQQYADTQQQSALTQFGQAAGYFAASDENIKIETGKPADTAKALSQVVATPVEDGWQYDPAKGGPDDGGQPHTGPMAQQVRAKMGSKVAPDGKVIDLVSMNGKLMASMQELAKKVSRLEKRVAA